MVVDGKETALKALIEYPRIFVFERARPGIPRKIPTNTVDCPGIHLAGLTRRQAHLRSGMAMADSAVGIRGGGDEGGKESRPDSNHGGGVAHHPKQKKRGKLPKQLEPELVQLLKVLNMMAAVLEQR